MESVHVERLEHFGVMAAVIKDLELIELINARLIPAAQATLTPGEAVAGMILHGLGCAHRPLSLTPQFLARRPLDRLFREGVEAEMFNRFKLGRTLDAAYAYGCDLRFQELALAVCAHEGIDLRFNHLDTPSFALRGEYIPERDEQAMTRTHGDAKDHRPDLKPAVLELMVSHDGGVPFVSTSWEGNTADIQVFQARAQGLMTALQSAPSPRYLIADAKRSHEAHAPNLQALGFMTRIPTTIGVVSQVMMQALTWDRWHGLEETTRDQGGELCHDGMAQRWLVVCSPAARERAEATVTTARQRDDEAIETPRFHLQAQRFATPEAAQQALAALATAWQYPQLKASRLIEHTRNARNGRPTPHTPRKASEWHIDSPVRPNEEALRHRLQGNAGLVLGTNISARALSDPEGIAAYKGPAQVEGGLRFLTDPLCFVSALFVKKPCRIEGLLMVMTLALLVYSVTQRRRRHQLARQQATVPNQLHQPTERPTVRWVFPRLAGIHRVRVTVQGELHDLIEGLNEVTRQILRLFGERVCHLYQIAPG
jgi:transposase